tara:strand:+ start:17777 stop:21745 length:3969 start_codon:yes stop_codon:yes gene_type:complete
MGGNEKYFKEIKGGLIGILLLSLSGFAWVSTDRLVAIFIDRNRPKWEKEFSKTLGHPLLIGQYKGLRPWGVALGATNLLPGYNDLSTVSVSGLKVQIAPFSSLASRRPVAVFTLTGANFNLIRNAKGSYWELGPSESKKPKNLELRFRLNEPSRVVIQPLNFQADVEGQIAFAPKENKLKGILSLDFAKQGSFQLKGMANWKKLNFKANAGFENFKLSTLKGILPNRFNLETEGNADGTFQVEVREGNLECNGGVVLSNLNLSGIGIKDPLSSKKVALKCKEDALLLPTSQWQFGVWDAIVGGEMPLVGPDNLNLGLVSSVRHQNESKMGLELKALLPFLIDKKGFRTGNLFADFDLQNLALNSLNPYLKQTVAGNLSSKGTVQGPISALNANLSFSLKNPQFSRVRLQEQWEGEFIGSSGGGGQLKMNSLGAAVPADISARIRDDWRLDQLKISRLGGSIGIDRNENSFKWKAKDFRLDRIEISLLPERSFKRIFGRFSGDGNLGLTPIFVNGKISLGYPRFLGWKLKEANLKGSYIEDNYSIKGDLWPLDKGQIALNVKGRVNGQLWSKTQLKKVTPSWIVESAIEFPKLNLEVPLAEGSAKELEDIAITPVEGSLDSQLTEWIRSVIEVARERQLKKKREFINPDDLRGYVDAEIEVKGTDLRNLNIDLVSSGKLWAVNQNINEESDVEKFTATIRGPLRIGEGKFSLENIPFALLSLFIPSPSGLTGMFGFRGNYRLGKEEREVSAELTFNKVGFSNEELILKKGNIVISDSFVKTDLVLQSSTSSEPITLAGQIPLSSSLPIDLRIESHGDGIRFLDKFFERDFNWKSTNIDFIVSIRGTYKDPEANGFLVVKNSEIIYKGKTIKQINGTILFDFNRVEFKNVKANIGSEGVVLGSGAIALFSPGKEEEIPLSLMAKDVQLSSSYADITFASSLLFRGALLRPIVGGDVTINQGSISTQRSAANKSARPLNQSMSTSSESRRLESLPEQKWNRKDPLVLFIRDENAPATKMVNSVIPKGLSAISFDNLRLQLGPELRIVSPPLTSFEIDGFILLNGKFDKTIRPSGLVRLVKGRVNLFTTTFNLDRNEQNVAIFVPSMGLIPYVDVKMTTRVPDTVRDPSDLSSSSDFMTNGSGSFGIGGSRFVKVEVIATGALDRLGDNYKLRSTPPIPETELLGLIGGNSIANLFQGGDNRVFADVINRSLVTPVLGNISSAFREKLQFYLYPAYVSGPEVDVSDNQSTNADDNTGKTTTQQAWVTEVGIDMTDRITFSIQATPNREDIPSQGNITYQLNQNFGLLGSFDKNGNWQSQLEIFLRY